MRRFLDWLRAEAKGWDAVTTIFKVVVINFVWSSPVAFLFEQFGISRRGMGFEIPYLFLPDDILPFFAFGAAAEEFLFRFLPLVAILQITKNAPKNDGWVLGVTIASSMLFGYLHGGVPFIFLQGVLGFLLSVVFLKCGGFQGKFLKAIVASSLCHLAFNLLIVSRVLAGG